MDEVRYLLHEALRQVDWLESGETTRWYPDQRKDAALVVREALHGLYETVARRTPAQASIG